MIVISGALVVVALVLLVLGVTGPELDLVYGSIAVSLLSLVFLVLGIIQRRGEVLPAPAGGPSSDLQRDDPVRSTVPGSPALVDGRPADAGQTDDLSTDDPLTDDSVTDDPRTDDAATDDLPVDDPDSDPSAAPVTAAPQHQAGEPRVQTAPQGSTGAGEALAGAPLEPAVAARTGSAPLAAVDEDTSGTVLVVANRPRYHVAGCRYLAGKTAETRDVSDAVAQGFTPCGVCKPDDALRGGASQADALFPAEPVPPARAARVAAPRAAPAPRAPAEQVVVIPDRNRYHRADCRHVRGLAGAEMLQPVEAVRQGYSSCGVCRP